MSVVERALNNLKKAAGAAPPADRRPIARVAQRRTAPAGSVSTDAAVADSRPQETIEFDLNALRNAGLYSAGNQRLADEYRIIKRPILKAAQGAIAEGQKRPNLLMVASALPGEGKTFTSVNLSMSLSNEKDWHVLLIDVDCKNPQLSRLLGVADRSGLLDLLRDPTLSLDEVLLATNLNGLQVLPLGTPGEDAAELLASDRMSALCDVLAEQDLKRLVICDSSPLLVTTESIVLSGQVGQVIVVVNAWKTPQQAVQNAVEKLDPTVPIGLVLNRVDESNALNYGYGYGSYPNSAQA